MSNPALNERTFRSVSPGESTSDVMTLPGAITKSAILVLILVLAGALSWSQVDRENPLGLALLIGGAIGGFIVALVTIFVPRWSPITAPIYAVLQGLAMGVISAVTEAAFHGIVFQAVALTTGVLAIMLFLYATRILQPTQRFMIGLLSAMVALCLFYLVSWVLLLFGVGTTWIGEVLYGSGWMGIGFSVVVVVIAALNLIIDFGVIESGAAVGAPKYMEWYGGFGLLVTLVWLYLEILRLLVKLRQR
jgi:uncharacterized YccA/Bax inhibitor family protein